ncbi:MAG: anthranilate synthase component I family protein [Acidimicrobiales bacterium]
MTGSSPHSRAHPSLDEFCKLAAEHAVVPVWREVLADLGTPVAAFLRLVPEGTEGFLFESVERGEHWSRFSFVGRNPLATAVVKSGRAEVAGRLPASVRLDRGVLTLLEDALGAYRSPALPDLPPLHGGIVGYLGYDVVREVEHLAGPPPDDLGLPDAVLSVIGQVVAFDHWRQRAVLVDNVFAEPGWSDRRRAREYELAVERLDEMACELAVPLAEPLMEPPLAGEAAPVTSRQTTSEAYQDAVRAAKEHIFAGDIFQVVLSQRFDLDLGAEPFDVYRVLRQVNPSPYMYFLRHAEVTIVGSSPEPMVRLLEGRVISRPIAGARPRGDSEEADRRFAEELVADPKELAEHVMLVDLARNDVGRVVRPGTEVVDELMTLERYSHVMHLTSQVSGELAGGRGPIDVLRATLPAGTVSGAPKVRAMEIIDELEPSKRGPYAGIVGYVDFSGNMDFAITIRTMVVAPGGRAHVQAGAGIVAGSVPASEDAECANKAAALLAAVPAARRMSAARRSARAPV